MTALDAFQIKLKSGQSKFIARMRSWDDKMAVTKANREMKNDVYIDDDLIIISSNLRPESLPS